MTTTLFNGSVNKTEYHYDENWRLTGMTVSTDGQIQQEIAVVPDEHGNPKVKEAPVVIEGEVCPKCGGNIIKKRSRYGEYLACENHPASCDFTKQYNLDTGVECPECKKGHIVRKKGARSYFYGCSNYPECNFVMWNKPVEDKKCPKCGGVLGAKKNEIACINKNCGYKETISKED